MNMTIARGVAKKVVLTPETTYGVLPAANTTSAQLMRRVTSAFNLKKDTFESNEINSHYQVSDIRTGIRSAEGSLNGELSPGTYSLPIAAVMAKDFATVAPITGLSVTIAANGLLWNVTRTAGSWVSDGVLVGSVVRFTGGTLNAANVANNALIVALTATVLTIKVLSATNFVAEGTAVASVTMTVVGKQSMVPSTGHTDKSFTVEEFYSDISVSESYTGVKFGSANISIPATGLVTVDLSAMGRNLERVDTTAYFTAPTVPTTTGLLTSVNGALVVNGVPSALVTSASVNIERNLENAVVVGSGFATEVFVGRIRVSGSLSVYFSDSTFSNLYDQETPVSLVIALTTGTDKAGDVISLVIPKIKLTDFNKADAELGIVAEVPFTAVLNDVVTAGLPATTMMMQDSKA
jgi:hypothetical protein